MFVSHPQSHESQHPMHLHHSLSTQQMARSSTTPGRDCALSAMTPSRAFRAEAQVFTPAARSQVDDIDGDYYPLEVDTFMPGSPPETPFLRPSQLHTSTETTPRGPVRGGCDYL